MSTVWPVAVLLLSPLATPTPAAPAEEYSRVLDRARRGDIRGALTQLLAWAPEAIVHVGGDACDTDCHRAAALLHTEAYFIQLFLGNKKQAEAHSLAAERAWGSAVRGSGGSEFERRWMLARGYHYQEWAGFSRARGLYERVLRQFPDDPEALVAMGALHEQTASLPHPENRSVYRHGELTKAQAHYERALARQPAYHEARLRLGRVAQMKGQAREARDTLAALVDTDAPPIVRGYAHLFLGRIAEREAPDESIAQYRRAVTAHPPLQAAYLSLALALHGGGRLQEAAQVTLEGLRLTETAEADGWYGYHCRDLHGYRLAMDSLWAALRR